MKDIDQVINDIMSDKTITVTLDESQRQMVLMGLAALAVERPGWDMALCEIAVKIDNLQTIKQRHLDALRYPHSLPHIPLGKPMMYEAFKIYRAQGLELTKETEPRNEQSSPVADQEV